MTIQTLNTERKELLSKVTILTAKKKELYSNMDIEQPMSDDEKSLISEIANIYSRLNQIVKEKRKM